jgi:hypothetical protein
MEFQPAEHVSKESTMSDLPIKNLALGLVGAIVGGAIGCFIFQWVADQGFYAPIPGAMVGIGFSLAARKRHQIFGFICGVLGLVAGLAAEWMTFKSDKSPMEFLESLAKEPAMTWIMLVLGVVLAFSFGVGRDSYPSQRRESERRA